MESSTHETGQAQSMGNNFHSGGVGEASERLGLVIPTVWSEFGRLAQEGNENMVNLGQGFPDWLPPDFAIQSLVEAVQDSAQSPHQYTRPAGHPKLVQQLARRYSAHLRKEIDPFSEVAVTVGASQALYLSLQTLIKPGDEVILFEPFFDLYENQVKLAGGKPVYVPLNFVPYDESNEVVTGGDWILVRETLMKTVNTKTKAIILNSPHNPTGKIFTRDEMEFVAEALELADPECVVLSDEVYKYIVHSPPRERAPEESLFCRGHVHFASLPGMWEKTITISSAGKTFSATGWQGKTTEVIRHPHKHFRVVVSCGRSQNCFLPIPICLSISSSWLVCRTSPPHCAHPPVAAVRSVLCVNCHPGSTGTFTAAGR